MSLMHLPLLSAQQRELPVWERAPNKSGSQQLKQPTGG
jgi:hypothetical protein